MFSLLGIQIKALSFEKNFNCNFVCSGELSLLVQFMFCFVCFKATFLDFSKSAFCDRFTFFHILKISQLILTCQSQETI